MRNYKLYEALKEYCITSTSFFSSILQKPSDLPLVIFNNYQIIGPLEQLQSCIPWIVWSMFISKNEENLKQIDVYKLAINNMEEDEVVTRHLGKLVGTKEMQIRIDADTYLNSFLAHLLYEQKWTVFNEDIFDIIYQEFEDFFYKDVFIYKYLSPIAGFEMEKEKIELEPDFSIIKISEKEKSEIMLQIKQFGSHLSYQAANFDNYAFEFILETTKVIENDFFDSDTKHSSDVVFKKFYLGCTALRLFKEGYVSNNCVLEKNMFWEPQGYRLKSGFFNEKYVTERTYHLSNDEIPSFVDFWNKYCNLKQKGYKKIEIAERRFNYGYRRVNPEDQLIDYIIGLEALLFLNERDELRYKFSLRGSVLLGKNQSEREKIFKELKIAYDERCNVVHGGKINEYVKMDTAKIHLKKFVQIVENHLRSIIKEFISLCDVKTESQVIQEIDNKIIKGNLIG